MFKISIEVQRKGPVEPFPLQIVFVEVLPFPLKFAAYAFAMIVPSLPITMYFYKAIGPPPSDLRHWRIAFLNVYKFFYTELPVMEVDPNRFLYKADLFITHSLQISNFNM
jgi:hypothetical protein